ncbi:MAG: bifunctional phosphoribosylaminoimidazolecarboxamide formyltransferase/IMP cyclohydrolase, partial [Flavisolibacter sp.]
MSKKITSALISVFYKDGLEPVVRALHNHGVTIYSTGGTQNFIQNLGIEVVPVEELTSYPSILGGRVKTLHPSVFGGILGRRHNEDDIREMQEFRIPIIDLVIVDLYPFEETVASTNEEKLIIEKIDIGGPSMIRAAAKNFSDVAVIASKEDYPGLVQLLESQNGEISLEQRRAFAAKAFKIVTHYDIAINNYFHHDQPMNVLGTGEKTVLRYGENPHQQAIFYGNLKDSFDQLHGKELSYNNLVDVDAAIELIREFDKTTFAIIKHTNVCGVAIREQLHHAWEKALEGDPESAFGGVLVCNAPVDAVTAKAISEIFFEVLIAKSFDDDALQILQGKKNRILLQLNAEPEQVYKQYKSLLNGT